MRQRRSTKWVKRILAAAAVLVVLAFATTWMLFQRIPAWYTPPEIAPNEIQAVKNDFAHTESVLSERLNEAEPSGEFEFLLTQDQVNGWIAIRREIWPRSRQWLPSYLSQPMVVLDRDGIRVAALLTRQSLRSVVSLRVEVRTVPDGVSVRLAEVTAGGLPVPQSQIHRYLKQFDRKVWPVGQVLPGQIGPYRLPSLTHIQEGIRLPDSWIWANGKQPFRITAITFEAGQVRIGLEPLPRSILQEEAR
jgi:hypothetical protein